MYIYVYRGSTTGSHSALHSPAHVYVIKVCACDRLSRVDFGEWRTLKRMAHRLSLTHASYAQYAHAT